MYESWAIFLSCLDFSVFVFCPYCAFRPYFACALWLMLAISCIKRLFFFFFKKKTCAIERLITLEGKNRAWRSATIPNPWRLPAHLIETYRIKRSFWGFELFCQLFPKVPTMETGNDFELSQDRKVYLARLQQWECEAVASIVPFLFRLLERISDPADFRNQANHLKISQWQWNSFLSQAMAEETICINEELSPWQNAESWRKRLSFAACVCEE